MNRIEFSQAAATSARQLIELASVEDLNSLPDCTSSATIPASSIGSADFVAREQGVVCGLAVARLVVEMLGQSRIGESVKIDCHVNDGDSVSPGTKLAAVIGPAQRILETERIALNFLGRLSGVASLTNQYVEKVAGTKAKILDTRKTTPGWRHLEKYAVACGGGTNHRMGLYDAMLIKDNHIAMCETIQRSDDDPTNDDSAVATVLQKVRDYISTHSAQLPHGNKTIIQLEVDRIEQLEQALHQRVDIVLLDNMSLDTLRQCVALRDEAASDVLLEASGGVNLDTVADIASTGVDRISIGALTHSATNFDIGLDWVE